MSESKAAPLIPEITPQSNEFNLEGSRWPLFDSVKSMLLSIPTKYIIGVILLLIIIGLLIYIYKKECFTNEIEQVTLEPEEPCHDGTDSNLINTPLCSEKTYQNTSLENTAPSEFEVLKNFDILETNNIISVKERIDGYIDQPTFLPGKFN